MPTVTEDAEESAIVYLLQELLAKGYSVEEDLMKLSGKEEREERQSVAPEEETEEVEKVQEAAEPTSIAIQMPLKQFTESQLANLYALVDAKGHLMKKAFVTEKLQINGAIATIIGFDRAIRCGGTFSNYE